MMRCGWCRCRPHLHSTYCTERPRATYCPHFALYSTQTQSEYYTLRLRWLWACVGVYGHWCGRGAHEGRRACSSPDRHGGTEASGGRGAAAVRAPPPAGWSHTIGGANCPLYARLRPSRSAAPGWWQPAALPGPARRHHQPHVTHTQTGSVIKIARANGRWAAWLAGEAGRSAPVVRQPGRHAAPYHLHRSYTPWGAGATTPTSLSDLQGGARGGGQPDGAPALLHKKLYDYSPFKLCGDVYGAVWYAAVCCGVVWCGAVSVECACLHPRACRCRSPCHCSRCVWVRPPAGQAVVAARVVVCVCGHMVSPWLPAPPPLPPPPLSQSQHVPHSPQLPPSSLAECMRVCR